jgi:DedD protein
MAAPEDANLDDLRRRARRRLVGAIVLALAVAVFVPMLLESDPKPLGEDVSVKIPPVDDGKFVNRLGDKGKAEPPKALAKAAEPRTEAPKAPPPEPPKPLPPEPKAVTPKEEPPRAEPPKEEPPKAEPSQEPRRTEPPPAAAAKPEPAKEGAAPKAANEPTAGEFSVQVFAFSDDKGANSLVNKLKGKGFPAYSEPVNTSRGTLWRVRVGPFPSREGASAAREKLKGEGYNGIVASAR